jgi:hypothetical protein
VLDLSEEGGDLGHGGEQGRKEWNGGVGKVESLDATDGEGEAESIVAVAGQGGVSLMQVGFGYPHGCPTLTDLFFNRSNSGPSVLHRPPSLLTSTFPSLLRPPLAR